MPVVGIAPEAGVEIFRNQAYPVAEPEAKPLPEEFFIGNRQHNLPEWAKRVARRLPYIMPLCRYRIEEVDKQTVFFLGSIASPCG